MGDVATTLWSLQYLRFIASTLVVVTHVSGGLRQAGYLDVATFHAGNAGVEIFFVISGIVMVWTTATPREGATGSFFRARAIRLLPLSITATLAAAVLLRGGDGDSGAAGFMSVVRALVFLPSTVAGTERLTSVYGPAWTLSFEVLFYTLFGLLLFMNVHRRVVAVSAVLIALVLTGLVVQPTGLGAFVTDPLLLGFVAGMAIAIGLLRWTGRLDRRAITLLVAVHLGAWVAIIVFANVSRDSLGDIRVVRWGIPAAIIVATAVAIERGIGGIRRVPILARLGDASYATYMTHLFVIRIGGELWQRAGLTTHAPRGVLFVLLVIGSIGCGSLVDRWFDRPVRRWWEAHT